MREGTAIERAGVTEHQLIDRALEGDSAAERAIYDRHVDRIYRLAYRLSGDEALAQEFTQDTFVRAFERLDQFRRESALATWLYAIARSVIYNGLRKVRRRQSRQVGLEEMASLGENPTETQPDLKKRLKEAIDGLPMGYRTVFVMHEIEGYTHDEIAETLGVQTGTSKAQLSRARARLRDELSEFAEEWMSR